MKNYLNLLSKILIEGKVKSSGRNGMPDVKGLTGETIKMDLSEGFPLLTTKKMFLKGIVHELLWFIRGETNIKSLVNNNIHIWDKNAYTWYKKYASLNGNKDQNCILHDNGDETLRMFTFDEFIEEVKKGNTSSYKGYTIGDMGKIYGYQWRSQNGIDQLKECYNSILSNPYSRYHIIDAWNKVDFPEMGLPPCHMVYQFTVMPPENDQTQIKILDLTMYQRSCDTLLGVPFNIASMALFLEIMAKAVNMKPGKATWVGGDVHIYLPHIPVVKEQLRRTPLKLPKIEITKALLTFEDIVNLKPKDIVLKDYVSYPKLAGELFG